MINKHSFLLIALIIFIWAFSQSSIASTGEEHQHSEVTIEGPNGGKLLSDDGFAVEITIFESGIPPEMRVYAYYQGEILQPDQIELDIKLHRLGDVTDALSFTTEKDYLVSNEVVVEPHSYEVSVTASYRGQKSSWHYEAFEGRTSLSNRVIEKAGILVEDASAKTLNFKERLFGVIAPVNQKIAHIQATYSGKIADIFVDVGDQVSAGQTLARIINSASGVSYDVVSPIAGEVTDRFMNAGEIATDKAIFEIVDLSSVWVELSAFPENIEKLKVGQKAKVFDLHQHESVTGEIIYIAPQMTGGHIARARVLIENPSGHWRPGMHVQADVSISQKNVDLAVRKDAVQTFRGMPVVFARYGNTFEVRMVELGESDGEYIEVTGGLVPNTPYVYGNSFILKADVLKDGASHDH
ncbi:acetyl-CoA carboxylase biotin carboxyl carrier protein subunit [Pseudidiomarina aestuarii]|uniref:Acetyl-CoA carboxylase biotin carboxyl carrier protein subunit n=1 Tax=Pseudidiomarina aestuarii TaxID=624146 RepID=A0A2T4CNP6_9GAMM|nr:acetyl-CoA carboxylase biotin carboxyl carrier protein subunit [Pseudidiomarina aestuarii]